MVDDPWFTGYETNPRWLRLVRSQVGMRSAAQGFELERPADQKLASVFDDICNKREDVLVDGEQILLTIPQADHGTGPVDAVDRVVAGATLLKEFVSAGL